MKLQALLLAVLVTAALADSVTDELEKNGLPVGLLPSSVTSYAISPDGHFSLSLDAPCYAKIDDQVGAPQIRRCSLKINSMIDSLLSCLRFVCVGGLVALLFSCCAVSGLRLCVFGCECPELDLRGSCVFVWSWIDGRFRFMRACDL